FIGNSCQCIPGFTGIICDTQIPIIPIGCNPGCQNGGVCIGNSCQCNPGFTGTYCESRDFCSPNNPCQNGGRCISSNTNFICDCTGTGYTGVICTDIVSIDVCIPNPCQNSGTCHRNGNSFLCTCVPGWTGTTCTVYEGVLITTTTAPNVSPCVPNPCLNGGICYANGNSFLCSCLSGWTGATCTVYEGVMITTTTAPNVSPCVPNPCLNDGICYVIANSFVCRCLSGWTGATCQLFQGMITTTAPTTPSVGITCANRPCINGGTCFNNGDSYFCYCGPTNTFTGTNCEIISSTLVPNCPLNCAPGYCVPSGSTTHPYACMCRGTLHLTSCN
ncbi:unnamed protein product, partial [Rotaria sordida]